MIKRYQHQQPAFKAQTMSRSIKGNFNGNLLSPLDLMPFINDKIQITGGHKALYNSVFMLFD